jgi:hypothetical protein
MFRLVLFMLQTYLNIMMCRPRLHLAQGSAAPWSRLQAPWRPQQWLPLGAWPWVDWPSQAALDTHYPKESAKQRW